MFSNVKVSFGETRSSRIIDRNITLDEVFSITGGTHEVSERVMRLIEMCRSGDVRQSEDAKSLLPYFTTSGVFSIRKAENLRKHSLMVQLDYDKVVNPSKLKEDLFKLPSTVMTFLSPRGQGVKAIVAFKLQKDVRPPINNSEHKEVWVQIDDFYSERLNLRSDPSCKDLTRCCYLSHDTNILMAEDKNIKPLLVQYGTKEATHGENEGFYDFVVKKGGRRDALSSWLGTMMATSASKETIREQTDILNDRFIRPKFTKVEMDDVCKDYFNENRRYKKNDRLFVPYREQISDYMSNVLHVLNMELRYNIRSHQIEVSNNSGMTWEKLDDLEDDYLSKIVHNKCLEYRGVRILEGAVVYRKKKVSQGELYRMVPIEFSTSKLRELLRWDVVEKRIDPFICWLNDLPPWDGLPRLDKMISKCFDVDGDPRLVEWASSSVLISAIARTYRPACKKDEVVVLSGEQSIGKSAFWKELLADEEWFGDDLNLAGSSKERVESMMGLVIVECSELHGTRRADIENLKAFITRRYDQLRLAYRRDPQMIPRRSVIVGTTNEAECLPNDPTGNRRFVVIKVRAKFPNSMQAVRRYHEEE